LLIGTLNSELGDCYMKKTEEWNLLKEPLLHFLLIGVALFLLYGWRSNSASLPGNKPGSQTAQIVVSREAFERMNTQFIKTWQRQPTEEEQKRLTEDLIRNEIFYREAIAIGLDRDDAVLKRRLRQKMEFIYENISDLAEPSDEDLQTFMETHREKYITDPEIGFHQVYINVHQRGDNAVSHAQRLLGWLEKGADPNTIGDVTLLEPQMPLSPLRDIARQFGDEFTQYLLKSTLGKWTGPISSGYGLHLVLVTDRISSRLPDLEAIRTVVRRDWMAEQQRALKDAAYAKLRQRYTVIVEEPEDDSSPLADAAAKERAVP
jgi:hypothetical protein